MDPRTCTGVYRDEREASQGARQSCRASLNVQPETAGPTVGTVGTVGRVFDLFRERFSNRKIGRNERATVLESISDAAFGSEQTTELRFGTPAPTAPGFAGMVPGMSRSSEVKIHVGRMMRKRIRSVRR
jgi:hypothetical protein